MEVTWENLITTLKDIDLNLLASEIETYVKKNNVLCVSLCFRIPLRAVVFPVSKRRGILIGSLSIASCQREEKLEGAFPG